MVLSAIPQIKIKKRGAAPTKTSPEQTLKVPGRTAAGTLSASTHHNTNADGANEKNIGSKAAQPFLLG